MNRRESENRDLFAIADLAREFGISTRAIRFYEAKGLLTPERVGSTRVFRRRDRARLILILRGKRLGFSLRDISDCRRNLLILFHGRSTSYSASRFRRNWLMIRWPGPNACLSRCQWRPSWLDCHRGFSPLRDRVVRPDRIIRI